MTDQARSAKRKAQSANGGAQGPAPAPHWRSALCALRFASPAFTLLEVLIGILILALALLGLGAVIPVVVRTQKLATDATRGVSVANAAQVYLTGRADLNRLQPPGATTTNQRTGWGVWLLRQNWSPAATTQGGPGPNQDAYLWQAWHATNASLGMLDPATGEMRLEHASNPPAVIGVGDRLWPARNSGGIDPEFIWDLVGRRVRVASGQPPQLQIALFVRRIDLNIRVPKPPNPSAYQWTLYDVLTGTVPQGEPPLPPGSRRLPLARDQQGLPTNTGFPLNYAAPMAVPVGYNPVFPQRLVLDPGAKQTVRDLARQIGQKWVDNLGNIYTVVGLHEPDATGNTVLIDPHVPAWVPNPTSPGVLVENTLRQIAFTPQVPAYVTVSTLTPLDPK